MMGSDTFVHVVLELDKDKVVGGGAVCNTALKYRYNGTTTIGPRYLLNKVQIALDLLMHELRPIPIFQVTNI